MIQRVSLYLDTKYPCPVMQVYHKLSWYRGSAYTWIQNIHVQLCSYIRETEIIMWNPKITVSALRGILLVFFIAFIVWFCFCSCLNSLFHLCVIFFIICQYLNFESKKFYISRSPGTIYSLDDFYILSSGIVSLETTLFVFNQTLFQDLNPLGRVLEPIRSVEVEVYVAFYKKIAVHTLVPLKP